HESDSPSSNLNVLCGRLELRATRDVPCNRHSERPRRPGTGDASLATVRPSRTPRDRDRLRTVPAVPAYVRGRGRRADSLYISAVQRSCQRAVARAGVRPRRSLRSIPRVRAATGLPSTADAHRSVWTRWRVAGTRARTPAAGGSGTGGSL